MSRKPETSAFLTAFHGTFKGLLQWDDLDRFWAVVQAQAGAGWHIYAVGETPPKTPATADAVKNFIHEINMLLRRDHHEDICGIVYADSLTDPTLIKIYDPHNLGVACGYSDHPPLPGWVMSVLLPSSLQGQNTPPQARRRWWQRLWATH
ncbi:MAG: hypothetical protein OEW08_05090 [Gammaproteobacteria bacterium]|nr:hypothetical protein [Gammaproteobacteria bacterium]